MEEYIAENLRSYGPTDEQVTEVMQMFDDIDDKLADIREVAYDMREQGATVDEIVGVIDPMIDELLDLKEQLVSTLEGYGITIIIPQNQPERPEGPSPPIGTNVTSSPETLC